MIAKFEIEGMSCHMCAGKVESTVKSLVGVTDVQVVLDTNSMTVNYDSKVLSPADIIAAVESKGYGAKQIDNTQSAEHPTDNLKADKAVTTTKQTSNTQKHPTDNSANTNQTVQCPIQATTVTAKFDIEGMSCSACSASIETAVRKLSGVAKADVNLLTNSMTVHYDSKVLSPADIIAAVESKGYGIQLQKDDTSAKVVASPKKSGNMTTRLIVSIVATVLLMYVSMGSMIGLPLPAFLDGINNAVSFATMQLLLTMVVVFANQHYFVSGFPKLFRGSANMDSLIAVGCTASIAYGIFAIFMLSYGIGNGNLDIVHSYYHQLYFESAAMILTLVTVGKTIESKSKDKTKQALDKLKQLVPPTAILLDKDSQRTVDSDTLVVGNLIVLKAGMSIPADCVITSGSAFVDESAITGESIAQEKQVGDNIVGGTIVVGGYLEARVVGVGKESKLSQIIALVESASNSKPPIANIADKIARVFVPIVLILSLITLIVWLIVGLGVEFALARAISVLVISCPCALGLATPLTVMVATGKGANNGILIKSGQTLEQLSTVTTVLLDKTGTITTGKPTVTDIVANGITEQQLLSLVASIEQKSEHPLGIAVVEYAIANGIATVSVDDFVTLVGQGVKATIGKDSYAIGNIKLMDSLNVDQQYMSQWQQLSRQGKTVLIVANNNQYIGMVAVADTIKPTSKQAIQQLVKQGIKVVMLTGDNQLAAQYVAEQVGIDTVHANCDPTQKADIVASYKDGTTLFVGDGINDAPTLATADIGVAVASGSDIAIDSAQCILLKDDLVDVARAIRLGKLAIGNIKGNLFWAFAYNILGIPLAMGVLYYTPWQLVLSPMIGALAMSLSSLFVVGNALTLYGRKLITGDGQSDHRIAKENNHE